MAKPLRDDGRTRRPARTKHTVPIGPRPWNEHATALIRSIDQFASIASKQPVDGYADIHQWVGDLLDAGQLANSHLLAAEPFAPFDAAEANDIIRCIEECLDAAAQAVEAGGRSEFSGDELHATAGRWMQLESRCDPATPIQAAFGLDVSPLDSGGEFRAEWVLQQHAYNSGEMLSHVVPHLESLGVAHVHDVLACVSIVGWILSCDDPISAYVAMEMFLGAYLAADSNTVGLARGHLEGAEPAMRRATQAARRSHGVAVGTRNREAQALALVDVYKRIVEGPFRQFSWAVHCLGRKSWEAPVTLGPLRERLLAAGGNLAVCVDQIVLPDLRNSETHETLEWDGFAEEFVTEHGRVAPIRVAVAVSLAEAFVHGCEAGLAAVRTLDAQPERIPLPAPHEPGRLASWRRVRAFFGTNRLRLVEAQLNARHATIQLDHLEFRDINPCFQALVLTHRLLPQVEAFSVGTAAMESVIEVSAVALEATMASWEFAVSNLDQMPLATFLPANLDTRRRIEPVEVAVRSVAWIAVDDLLDAIDGSPDEWSVDTRSLLDVRLSIVEIAVVGTARLLAEPSARINAVLRSVAELRQWIAEQAPARFAAADGLPVVAQLRIQWARWGPVSRLPLIPDEPSPGFQVAGPALRERPPHYRYQTL